MTKAAEMAKITTKSSFHLLWGLVGSTIISAIGTIYIANLLLSEGMGLYTLAIATPTLIGVFRDWGVTSAIIRYTAQYNVENQVHRIRNILVNGLLFEIVVGIVLTIVSFILSSLFASIYNLAAMEPLLQIASFTILINAFFTVAQSAFTGLERMELNSVTLIIQSVVKVVLTIGLVILGLGVFGAIVGYIVSLLLAGVTGTLFMFMLCRKMSISSVNQQLQHIEIDKTRNRNDIKMLLVYGLPLSVAAIITAFQMQFNIILIGAYATADAVVNYALATTFVVLITFFASPITMMLFPAFSKLDAIKDKDALRTVYKFSVKYATLLVVPVAMIVMALSEPGIATLFSNKYPSAPLYLSLLAITYLYTAFGSLTTGNLLNSQGKTGLSMMLSILTAAIGIPLSWFLASQIGVLGIIITALVAGVPGLIISLQWIKRHYDLMIDWVSSTKILIASGLAGATTFIIQLQMGFSSVINLLIGATVFTIVFLPSILMIRVIDRSDIENLRTITTSLGPINRILNPALNTVEKLLSLINPSEKEHAKLKTNETLL
jgi:O-antigen/teichoic acid export membrane protein